MRRFSVYILRCSDGSFYTGVTSNLALRYQQHMSGTAGTGYMAKRLPVELVFSQEFATAHAAIAAEKKIKGWRREKKQALIEGRLSDLPVLSKRGPRHPSTSSG